MASWFAPLKNVGRWIWLAREPGAMAPRVETGLFCGRLTPPEGTRSIELHVSAEGRYTLWIGEGADPLGHGPARTGRYQRSLDTYSLDVSEAGGKELVLWAQVRWFAGIPEAPTSEMLGPFPAFLAIALFLDE